MGKNQNGYKKNSQTHFKWKLLTVEYIAWTAAREVRVHSRRIFSHAATDVEVLYDTDDVPAEQEEVCTVPDGAT